MRLRFVTALLVTMVLAPFVAQPAPMAAQQTPAARKVLVDKTDQSTAAELAQHGGIVLVDYGSFALWSVPEPQVNSLRGRTSVAVPGDLDTIALRGGASIDTRAAASPPNVPSNLRQTQSSDPQLWLVQFVGPIKEAWLDDLKAAGLQIVMYMPSNAYVVWGDGTAVTRLETAARKNPVVQFTGPYHPAYRVAPAVQQASAEQAGSTPLAVTVQFFTTSNTPQSLARLQALGGRVYRSPSTTLTLTNISLDLPAGQIAAVAAWPDVFNVERYAPPKKNDEAQGQVVAGNVTTVGGNVVPVEGIGSYLAWLTSKGFPTTPASYPIVDVVDDGIDNGTATPLHPDFYELGSKSNPDRLVYNHNCTPDALPNAVGGHGNLNAAIVGAYNNLIGAPHQDARGFRLDLGISPYGRLAGTKIFPNAGGYDISACGNTDQGVVLASFTNGATMTSNSWGNSFAAGAYDAGSQAYDALTRDASAGTPGNQQMLHVFSAGNNGPSAHTLGSPGTAKNVLTVGATENARDQGIPDGCNYGEGDDVDDVTYFSSRGPTDDNRVKPDIMAPGAHITAAASQDPGFDGTGVCGGSGNNYYPTGQTLYTWSSGTSHSTPAVAGAAQLLYEYYGRVMKPGQTPSPAMLKALLLNTPRYLTGVDANDTLPSPKQGWGDINLGLLFDDTTRYLVDQQSLFTATGQVHTWGGTVAQAARPLRVTLAWTDAPGSTTGHAFVNDLDLAVVAGGNTYLGNHFTGANSSTGGSSDPRNNVESVFLPGGITGPITVAVLARNIAGDGVPGNASALDQDYALVISNANVTPVPSLVRDAVTTSDATGNTNGFVDPGETVSMQVGAVNVGGDTTTGLTSTLAVVSGSATVTTGTSGYPNIAPGATATNSTPYQVQVAQTQACGTPVTLRHTITSGASSVLVSDVPLLVGKLTAGAPTTYSSTDLPKAIPDGDSNGTLINLTVPAGPGVVGDVNVRVSATHTYVGDLTFQLISPSGKVVTLLNRRGEGTDNLTNTVFDDDATVRIDQASGTFTGTFRPETPLAALVGEPIAGTWKLKAIDFETPDAGSVTAFALDIETGTFDCQVFGPRPDLTLTKTHAGSFTVGQNGVYTLTATNSAAGPDAGPTTSAITVTDTLPTGLTYVSGTGPSWTCNAVAQDVTCTNPGPLAPGASSAITLTVGVGAAAVPSVTNSASVAMSGELNTANNGATDPTTVIPTFALTVQKAGSGTGTVTSGDAKIDCGAACSATYAFGSVVNLTVAPAAGSTFTGWSGACTGTGACSITVDAAKAVTATFAPRFELTAQKSGSGTGTITSGDAQITCGPTCAASYLSGTVVTLTATPAASSTFTGWSGACSGTGACQVTMDAARVVTATFALKGPVPPTATLELTVQRGPTGGGYVTSPDYRIACGSTCTMGFPLGTSVTLNAVSTAGFKFAGWSGACTGTGPCQVTMDASRSVTASFQAIPLVVQVSHAPGGPALAATLTARPTCGAIARVQLGEPGRPFDNARVSVSSPSGGPSGQTSGFVYTPPAATSELSITIQQIAAPGGATVAPIRVVDGCGEWQTLVGGGPDAFR